MFNLELPEYKCSS